jgi:benzylsuccinate CoA-transferase BbsF subunit
LIGGEAQDGAFAMLAGRKAGEDRLEALVEAWTTPRIAGAIERDLQAIGVPVHRAATSPDMVADPQLIARRHFVRLPHPLGGESVIEASRFQLSDTPPAYHLAAPHFGRDNLTVLKDILGYDDAQVADLEAAGVLR